ncbi:hypothetical protein R1flu_010410 [Riccia fluitans]|uniref:Uncharacterized protein n=1 Tax=Riccia fluitans TaxID=41844 RepID=A0ABD1Z4W2_9MARC
MQGNVHHHNVQTGRRERRIKEARRKDTSAKTGVRRYVAKAGLAAQCVIRSGSVERGSHRVRIQLQISRLFVPPPPPANTVVSLEASGASINGPLGKGRHFKKQKSIELSSVTKIKSNSGNE